MRPASAAVPAGTVAEGAGHNAIGDLRVATMAIPWSGPAPATLQGIVHVPAHGTPIKAPRRETLLTAIAKARQWVDDMAQGRTATFAQIARREDKVEPARAAIGTTGFPLAPDFSGHHRWHRAGQYHGHLARSRIILFLG